MADDLLRAIDWAAMLVFGLMERAELELPPSVAMLAEAQAEPAAVRPGSAAVSPEMAVPPPAEEREAAGALLHMDVIMLARIGTSRGLAGHRTAVARGATPVTSIASSSTSVSMTRHGWLMRRSFLTRRRLAASASSSGR